MQVQRTIDCGAGLTVGVTVEHIAITRENIDSLLDARRIELLARNGKWYSIRRNGATKRWKRDASRIAIPCKVGFRECFTITEADFNNRAELVTTVYRVKT